MAEYSRLAKGSFKAAGTSAIVPLPFKPDYVELWNLTNIQAAPAANKVTRAWWDAKLLNAATPQRNPTMLELYPNGSTTFVSFDTIVNSAASPGINAYEAGQLLQYGAAQAVSTITKANPAVVTSVSAHGLVSGDVVVFQNVIQSATTGMPQIHNIPFTVTVTGATTFTIPWNTNQSNYTAYDTATGTQDATFKKVLYPYLYFPGQSFISAITLGATTTIDTTAAHNFVVGQEVAFRIPSDSDFNWGTTQLNSLPNTLVPGSPVYGYVIAVTDYNTVVVNIDSSAYTAFNSNPEFSDVPGLSYPQIVAVGDVNTGGVQISAGSALYPPPYYSPIGTTRVNTINGPAIQGAFVNNTSMGFTIGSGVGVTNTGATIMAAEDIIYWHAYLHDYANHLAVV